MTRIAALDRRSALEQALQASTRAGVEIDNLDGSDVSEVERIIEMVWGPEQNAPSNLLRGLAHAGNVLLLARTISGEPIGFTLGYLGWSNGVHLHSHMTAVVSGHQSSGVGYALKLWQRSVCLSNEIDEIRWTYDPMIARNAYFNLVKLGAQVRIYLQDFYTGMNDKINAGDHADRFEVSWKLMSTRVISALEGGVPELRPAEVVLPDDFESLRSGDLPSAIEARMRVREVILSRMGLGDVPDWGIGGYVLNTTRETE